MSVGADNKSRVLRKKSVQEVSTAVDKNIIIAKQMNEMKGGGAELNG
jgi:hypothetical protein